MTLIPQINVSLEAEQDLIEIYSWIAADASDQRADLILGHIYNAIEQVAAFPFLGRAHADIAGNPRSYHVRPWQVVYRPEPAGRGILVLRVLDSRRDVANVLETGATA